MKRLNIARKFYPRLRYIRINISKLLAALLQVGVLQSSLVQSTGLPVVMASLVGAAGTAHAAREETLQPRNFNPGISNQELQTPRPR
ncbi:hypothetical protein [Methylobacillus glycogenes]|uniref:hypothetical protein n=1 Tax=Methylobacillus glycogenes TaxID=406 RepID=UPI00046E5A2E|nr:hypothetical protein [Methylobacillus glycogenes]